MSKVSDLIKAAKPEKLFGFIKGDMSGHEFRGNQYTGGGGAKQPGAHDKVMTHQQMATARREGYRVVTELGIHAVLSSTQAADAEVARLHATAKTMKENLEARNKLNGKS